MSQSTSPFLLQEERAATTFWDMSPQDRRPGVSEDSDFLGVKDQPPPNQCHHHQGRYFLERMLQEAELGSNTYDKGPHAPTISSTSPETASLRVPVGLSPRLPNKENSVSAFKMKSMWHVGTGTPESGQSWISSGFGTSDSCEYFRREVDTISEPAPESPSAFVADLGLGWVT